ncbi:MAG: hypothetical protein AB7H71_17655 [Alphaproteobacteria bacterium]
MTRLLCAALVVVSGCHAQAAEGKLEGLGPLKFGMQRGDVEKLRKDKKYIQMGDSLDYRSYNINVEFIKDRLWKISLAPAVSVKQNIDGCSVEFGLMIDHAITQWGVPDASISFPAIGITE